MLLYRHGLLDREVAGVVAAVVVSRQMVLTDIFLVGLRLISWADRCG